MELKVNSQFNEDKKAWVVEVIGEIDIYNSNDFKKKLSGLLEQNNTDVYIDCHALEYIDSTGLGALVSILKQLKQAENNLHLKNLRGNILKLFKITELDKVFIIDEVS